MSRYDSDEGGCGTSLAGIALVLAISAGVGEYVEKGYGPDKARTYLEQNGYNNASLTDTDTFMTGLQGCDATDAVKHEFIATAPNETRVKVMVCNGLFKGATIRQGGV